MARTFRSVPVWAKVDPEASPRWQRRMARAARGNDGAVQSENIASVKDGKPDNWSTTAKGRNNKRAVSKAIRRHGKAEVSAVIAAEEAENKREAEAAIERKERLETLRRAIAWEKEDAAFLRAQIAYNERNIERMEAELQEALREEGEG